MILINLYIKIKNSKKMKTFINKYKDEAIWLMINLSLALAFLIGYLNK